MFHDEAEIEEWFEEEKEKLSRVLYQHSLHRASVENAKQEFDARMKKLIARYNREHAGLTKRIARKKRLQLPLQNMKAWWSSFLQNSQKSRSEKKKTRKKEKFDKEYDRLMKK